MTMATAICTSRLRVGQGSVNILYSIKIALVAYILKAETSRIVRFGRGIALCCLASACGTEGMLLTTKI